MKKTRLDEIVELMTETLCSQTQVYPSLPAMTIPAEIVKSRLLKVDSEHIEFVLDCLQAEHN
jgi:hypothetical protein